VVLVASIPFVYTAAGLYRRDELVLAKTTLDEAPTVFQAATVTTMVAIVVESALLQTPIGAKLMAVTWVSLAVITLSCRVLARSAARTLSPRERCLVIGDAEDAARLARKFESGGVIKAELVGRWAPTRANGSPELAAVVRNADIHRVVIAGDPDRQTEVMELIRTAKSLGVRVSLLPRMLEAVGSSVAFDYLNGLTLLGVPRFGLSRAPRRVKRAFDVVGASVAIILLSPIMVAIAIAVKLSSRGPILFRQIRVGRDGAAFVMFKFRSMQTGADDRKLDLLGLNEADGLFKIDEDPRVTRVGRLLRRSSLDELPQLFNVLWGEMSLVGPRPLVIDEDRRIQGWRRGRLHLTPGMTGHWQVLGSARIPVAEMVTIDYLYIANWSLWGDIKILLRTVPHVFLRRGQ
jgi:exopolysaccharide biosynthesis polyprenyl glycosylphosphotransferase